MLDLRFVVENIDTVAAALTRRGVDARRALGGIEELAERRRGLIVQLEEDRHKLNEASREMAKANKSSPEFQATRERLKALGDRNNELSEELSQVEAEIESVLLTLPNLPSASTPNGLKEEDNPVVRVVGKRPEFAFVPKDHTDIGLGLGLVDFERAALVSGSRFVVLSGAIARMSRALIQLMLDTHADERGYQEKWIPTVVNEKSLYGTGQLPKFGEGLFRLDTSHLDRDPKEESPDYYLAPTAEVPLTNLHRGEIIKEEELPLRYAAYSACFRSEAGSYGRDTRGMIRQHQFDKVELVHFCAPEKGEEELAYLTASAERILQKLELHYRVVEHCAGELGFSAERAYDLEVWLPGQDKFREISSCSLCGEFQARRAKIRYRPEQGQGGKSKPKPRLVATLNGSGLAIGRTIVAILEQYQEADGSVTVPGALRPYMGGMQRLKVG